MPKKKNLLSDVNLGKGGGGGLCGLVSMKWKSQQNLKEDPFTCIWRNSSLKIEKGVGKNEYTLNTVTYLLRSAFFVKDCKKFSIWLIIMHRWSNLYMSLNISSTKVCVWKIRLSTLKISTNPE